MFYLGGQDQLWIEDVCYEDEHINMVWNEINKHLPHYFEKYVGTDQTNEMTEYDLAEQLRTKFGENVVKNKYTTPKTSLNNGGVILSNKSSEAILSLERDREIYKKLLNITYLESSYGDLNDFKNRCLKREIPKISKIATKKYKKDFNLADKKELWQAVFNIASRYKELSKYDSFDYLDDSVFDFDDKKYSVRGVISGDIKSHFLYKNNPSIFPNRSKNAVLALYYLTNQSNMKEFGCDYDSEFILINLQKGTMLYNFWYPYFLFSFYANKIANYLEKKYIISKVPYEKKYKFVYVDDFLQFIADANKDITKDLIKSDYND